MTDSEPTACPHCAQTGRKVDASTLGSLLVDDAKSRLVDAPMRFCRTPQCEVVYFAERQTLAFTTADVKVEVFQKSSSLDCLVCYCFGHSVGGIQQEVHETGRSNVPDAIGEKCKAGLDACEVNNPQGSCCLGNVRKVVRDAITASGGVVREKDAAAPACCSANDAVNSCGGDRQVVR